MKQKVCAIPFTETAEQREKLEIVIKNNLDVPGAVMPILQMAQDIYGYLPYEVQKRVADALNISLEEVYGVVTFYSQFSLNPRGKYNFGLCLGTACYVRGSGDILDRLKIVLGVSEGGCTADGLFSIQATRCIGCCGLAPVMTVNEEVYGKLTVDDIDKIVNKYRDLEKK